MKDAPPRRRGVQLYVRKSTIVPGRDVRGLLRLLLARSLLDRVGRAFKGLTFEDLARLLCGAVEVLA